MKIEILLTIIFTLMVFGWRPYRCRITGIRGECFNNLCNLTLTHNKTTLAAGMEFVTENEFEPLIFNILLTKVNADQTEKLLFNKSIDLCAFLQNKQSDQLFSIVFNDIKKSGLLITKCPVNGRYFIKDYIVDAEKLPPYMPLMKIRTDGMVTGKFAKVTGKHFNVLQFSILTVIDNSAGVNRLIKINGK